MATKLDKLFSFDEPETETTPTVETPLESDPRTVPNQFPTTNAPYRIAIIGDCPSKDDCEVRRPFQGMAGRFLDHKLSQAGISRTACFLGNVSQHRPFNSDIKNFSRSGPEITSGLEQLKKDLNEYNPNICLLLGKTPLWAAKGVDNLADWRGSLFLGSESAFGGRKCISSYHPAACLRLYEWSPLFFFDIKKCMVQAKAPSLSLPDRDLRINLSVDQIISELEIIQSDKPLIALDIEGYVGAMSCFSIATTSNHAFIIPLSTKAGTSLWTEDEEILLWRAFATVLEDPTIPKVLQNSLYDRFVFQYSYALVVRGVLDDTMLRHWELYCELEKSLGFQCSIYTNEPFYKSERKSDSIETFWTYCCKDSAVTWEINNHLTKYLNPQQTTHYRFNMLLLNPLLYMQLRGIVYDQEQANIRRAEVNLKVYEVQSQLDKVSGYGIRSEKTLDELISDVRAVLCYKRNVYQPKAGNEEALFEAESLIDKCRKEDRNLTAVELGQLSVILKVHLNVRSPKWKNYLYGTLALPVQYKRDPKTGEMRPSTDFESLIKLKKHSTHEAIDLGISLTMHRTRAQMLSIVPGTDGRIRCSYNLVGTNTGRISSSRSNVSVDKKRVGTNMQTVSDDWEIEDEELVLLTEGLRTLYKADEGRYMFQCDLRGADGWTIGAHMANLGDRTMLDDLLAGLKPAQIVCYILRYGPGGLMGKTRPEIKEILKVVKKEDWDYYVCKQVIWGTCYLMGPRKVADQVLKESYGKFALTEKEARVFQAAVFVRYRVKLLHDSMARHLSNDPVIKTFSGYQRRFFGRPKEILGEALAFEPQAVTTYATNLAMYKLWTDPENRIKNVDSRCQLRIEPLHQVHDALLGQFKIEDAAWAVNQIKRYFDNPLIIANQKITIPFEGNYGLSWGDLSVGTI